MPESMDLIDQKVYHQTKTSAYQRFTASKADNDRICAGYSACPPSVYIILLRERQVQAWLLITQARNFGKTPEWEPF